MARPGLYRSRYSTNLLLIGGGWSIGRLVTGIRPGVMMTPPLIIHTTAPSTSGQTRVRSTRSWPTSRLFSRNKAITVGEIDGLIGPLTRDALAAYQQAAGLPPTASVDRPTLESLGLT